MTGDFEQFINGLDEQNYYMIEEEIDIEIQNRYFKHSRKVGKNTSKEEVMNEVPLLNNSEVAIEVKKRILAQLATLRDVEAYRVLEKECRQFSDNELNLWSVLALNESRMILNGSLKNDQQVFISTGLGGKNGKFRYFVALFPDDNIKTLTPFQKDFTLKELDFTLKQNNADLEKILENTDEYMSFKILIPIKANIPKLFKAIINNCNQLSPFINKQFIITNVGEMDQEEIKDFLNDADDYESNIIEDIVSMN